MSSFVKIYPLEELNSLTNYFCNIFSHLDIINKKSKKILKKFINKKQNINKVFLFCKNNEEKTKISKIFFQNTLTNENFIIKKLYFRENDNKIILVVKDTVENRERIFKTNSENYTKKISKILNDMLKIHDKMSEKCFGYFYSEEGNFITDRCKHGNDYRIINKPLYCFFQK